MTTFSYTAISQDGRQFKGRADGPDRSAILQQLHAAGHFVVEVSEDHGSHGHAQSKQLSLFRSSPKPEQITEFARELSMLFGGGLPLDKSLFLLEQQAASPAMANVISDIRRAVTAGGTLHDALAKQNGLFPPVFINMVRVAEISGTLGPVLERLADAREKEQKLKAKAVSAMLYPAFLICASIAAALVMLLYVVPRFKKMIFNLRGEVPDAAAFVIGVSDWVQANGMLLGLGPCIAFLAVSISARQPAFRSQLQSLLFSVPVVGRLLQYHLVARFCRTLGTLLQNGVSLPDALKLTRDVMDNARAAEVIGNVHTALRKGQDFAGPMLKSGLFPPVVVHMFNVGQETGNLHTSALHLADAFENKLETAIERFFSILEPCIIAAVSLIVGGTVIAIMSAVISVNDLAL